MYINAPIHDLLIRIKNSYMARKTRVADVVYSKMKVNVLNLLKQYNFIKNYQVVSKDNKPYLSIVLNGVQNKSQDIPVINFKSTPGRKWYVGYRDIKSVAGGQGIGIISTNKGILPTHVAKKQKIGGELIAEIY